MNAVTPVAHESPPPSTVRWATPGMVLDGRYRLGRVIAEGGVGSIHTAEHTLTGRPVAIKLPLPAAGSEGAARLKLEARLLGLVRCRNVVDVLDAGEVAGVPYLALELLEGRTLEGLLAARGRLGVGELIAVARQLGAALDHVHRKGVVHRDVKPNNVFVTLERDAPVKLLDFGIARTAAEAHGRAPRITRENTLIGTPGYSAPESLTDPDRIDPKSDVYAFGVTLYECALGRLPFSGDFGTVLLKALSEKPASVLAERPDVPPPLAEAIHRCLDPNPEGRPQTLREVLALLEELGGARTLETPLLQGSPAPAPVSSTKTIAETPVSRNVAARRRHPRAPYVAPARLLAPSGRVDGRLEEISEGGLQFFGGSGCEAGTEVRVRFTLPSSGRVVEVAAVSRWSRARSGTSATGFEFLELQPDARQDIGTYVKFMTTER
ncbi:MAG: protein kinase [Polyangiaceae bacterium]|nr:protein kinase [Polyangiaceae bacterium]